MSLGRSLKEFGFTPIQFFKGRKELPVVYFVYGGTYLTANVTDTVCRTYNIPMEAPKFILVSFVNLATTIIKDRYLARLFGASAPG